MATRQAVVTASAPAPAPGARYSQAIRIGELVFTCGQLPIDPVTGKLVEGGIEVQVEQTMKNLAAVLEAAGSGLDKLVKTTVLLRYRSDWAGMNEVYCRLVGPDRPPARSAITVGEMSQGALVEIEAVAHV